MDCFVASLLAMTASRHAFAISPHTPREFCFELPTLSNQREQGMPGARCTRGLVCKIVRRNAHEHTGSAETLRHSPRNGFTAYAVLSPATNSSCHRRQRISGMSAPGWVDIASANLTPATGARTTRFCRTHQRRSSCALVDRSRETRPATPLRADAAASTASPPAFVTIAIRPSCREKDGASW
jgi:hypothetical protein